MQISEKQLCILRSEIARFVSGKRLEHTLSVEKEAVKLGLLLGIPENKIPKLAAAGLLHDITKGLTVAQQLSLAEKYGLRLSDDDIKNPKVLHSLTGAYAALENFPDFTDSEVFSSIQCHTTGKPRMTLFQKILYLADYIEPLRDFPDCIRLREYFYSTGKTDASHLDKTLILSFDMTVRNLLDEKQFIHKKTVAARNYILNQLLRTT